MLGVLRQRQWLWFSVFIVAMLALCVMLSRWQWGRYELRQTQNAALDAALGAPPIPVDDLLDAAPADPGAPTLDPALVWREVTAVGTFDTAAESAVRRRPLDGSNGYWIVTPLVTDSGVLLVNRGWTPAVASAAVAPEVPPPPTGQVSVSGRLRAGEPTTVTDAPPPGQAWAADPQVLVTPASVPRYNAYVELRDSTPAADAGLTELADPEHKGTNNLIYSGQWLIFGAVALIGWWRLVRQESRRMAAEASRGEPATARTAPEA